MQSSKAASGNKCNWLYGPHCILPPGHGEKLLHRLAPYQAVQRQKSLDSKGLAGHCEGLLAGSGGQDRKSDDAASLNPAASAGLGRGSKLYNSLSFPSATIQVPRPLFSLVLDVCSFLWTTFRVGALVSDVSLCDGLFTVLSVTFVQDPLTHPSAAASLRVAVQTPFSFSLFKMLWRYTCILPFSQPAWLSRAPHRKIEPQGAQTFLLPFGSPLP